MSKKKLFSDRRWTEPPAVVVLGKIKSTKEDKIMCIDFFLSQGIIDKDEHQRRLNKINEEYSNEKSGDENADDK